MNIDPFNVEMLRRYATGLESGNLNLAKDMVITRCGFADFLREAAVAIEVRDLEITNLRADLLRAHGEHRTPDFSGDDA